MSFFLVILAVVALPILAIVAVVKRGREMQSLVEHGRVARGRVAARRATAPRGGSRRNKRVQLMYELPDTGEFRRWVSVTSQQWQEMTEGAAIDIVYLPGKPSVFATRVLVNHARRTRGLPEL